jgi:hypothetical protein
MVTGYTAVTGWGPNNDIFRNWYYKRDDDTRSPDEKRKAVGPVCKEKGPMERPNESNLRPLHKNRRPPGAELPVEGPCQGTNKEVVAMVRVATCAT